MSEENRYKLFNGLAKLKILSKTKFKYFFPYCINLQAYCSDDCTLYLGSAGVKKCELDKVTKLPKPIIVNKCNIKAGDKIKIIYNGNKENIPIDIEWTIYFSITNKKGDITETLTVKGSSVLSGRGDVVGQFILPIISPYKYSNNIKQAYSIDTHNINVSEYPEACRN